MDIIKDPSCSRTINQDMALRGSAGLDITVASGGSTDHSDEFRPWWQRGPLDINMASGGSSKRRHPNGPW